MSKKSIINISALAVGLVLAGCSVLPEETLPDKGREIKFTASVGTFKVKATDTAFEIGDQIGLFADSPVNAENVRMTWDGTNLVPETSLFWAPGDEREVRFSAYYPYSPDRERYGQFFVNADQSTHALFTQSDFMAASESLFSTDGVVNLAFNHRFSKIVLHLDNQIQDLNIADVYVGNVRGRVEGDVWGYYSVTGNAGTIKAGKAVTPEGESVWALIIPSQNCRPQLMITTTDGKQFTYESEYEMWFERGFSYNAHVTMDGSSIFTDFTAQVTEWTDNNDLAFPMPGAQKWSVTGTSAGELPLVNCSPGEDVYYAIIYYEAGQELSFVKNGSTAYGYSADGTRSFVADGERIVLPATGVYEILLYPEDPRLQIFHSDGFPSWGITGTIERMNWTRDHYADFTTVSYVDDVPYPVLGYRIKYREGEQFKFRFWGQWNMEFGYPELWWDDYYSVTVPTDEFVPLMHQGSNIALPGDGLYEIYLDVRNERMLAVRTGDLPPVVPSAIEIDGDFSDWDKLDPYLVSVAYGAPDAKYAVLKNMKAYADAEALFVYFEYDPGMIYWEPDMEFVPFHIFVNADSDNSTGWWPYIDMYDCPGIDYLLEAFLYSGGTLSYEDLGVYKYVGEDRSGSWEWTECESGASIGMGNGHAYEIRLERSSMNLPDSFYVGIEIEQAWSTVGVLPNQSDGPAGLIPVNVGGPGVQMGDPDAVAPVYCNSVADAVYVQDNTPVKIENALVYAVTTRGFIIWDGPGSGNPALFVYHGYVSEPVVSVGVRVNVRGTKVTYRGVPEITNTDLSFEIVTHGESLPQIYYEELTAQLDNYPAYSIPGSYRGVLSGRTVACEGSSNLGELYWPFQDLSALEGATVRATGFTFYSYNGLSDLVADHIRVLDLPVESTITDVYNGNDGDYFKVTGTVTKLSSTRYGNYYLKDDDGNELSIYGTVSEWGYYPLDGVNWDGVTLAQAGVSVGSRVTVVGPRVTDGVVKLWDVILVDAVPGEPPYEPSQDPNYDQYYDWNFSSSEWVDAFNRYFPDGPSTNHNSIYFKVNGLLVDGGGQTMRYNYSNDRYFIQPNGPGSEYARYFSFEAPTPGKLYVWVSNTSASENLSRLVVVNQNGAISEQPGGYATTGGPVMLEFDVTGGNVKIYPTVGALRFYRMCFVGDGSEPVTPPDAGHESFVWDFSSERWQYELAQLGAVNTDILDWDITVDGLQFYSSAKSKYNTTFIQTGGRGSLTDRFFKFTAPKNGVLSVYVTNTGSSEALDREVAVYTSDDCTAFLPGGYPSSGGPVQVVFEGIPAGEVKIYPSVNGLRFYKIQFDY